MSTLEERIEAVEAWIERFEEDGEEFLKTVDEMVSGSEMEVTFIPDDAILRNKKRDN